MSGNVIPIDGRDPVCAVRAGESFSAHIRRCSCDVPAPAWARLDDRGRTRQGREDLSSWGETPAAAGAAIADAVVAAHSALYRLERMIAEARAFETSDPASRIAVEGRSRALDGFLVDPDALVIRAADVRVSLWALLDEHVTEEDPA